MRREWGRACLSEPRRSDGGRARARNALAWRLRSAGPRARRVDVAACGNREGKAASSLVACARVDRTADIFQQSMPLDRARSENQPLFVSIKKPPMRARTRRGLLERCGGSVCAFAGMTARIKSATPFPWVGVKRVADAPRDRPDANIAVVDVLAIWPFGVAPAGEGGHAQLKRDRGGYINPVFLRIGRWATAYCECSRALRV